MIQIEYLNNEHRGRLLCDLDIKAAFIPKTTDVYDKHCNHVFIKHEKAGKESGHNKVYCLNTLSWLTLPSCMAVQEVSLKLEVSKA